MANGGTFEQQATLSLIAYALLVKFIFAPLIDTYYLAYIGRSKTYIFILGLIAGVVLLIFAPQAGIAVQNKQISLLTSFWLFVNLLANFQQVAFESWTVTIVARPYRKYMAIMLVTGFATGYFASFNAFVCFNSVDCLQKYFSWTCSQKDQKMSTCNKNPWLSHTGFAQFMGIQVLVISFYVLLLVKERVVDPGLEDEVEDNPEGNTQKENSDGLEDIQDQKEEREEGDAQPKAKDFDIETPFDQEEGSTKLEDQTQSETNNEPIDDLDGDDDRPDRGLRGILCQFIPKLVKNNGMRAFVFYLIASRFFFELYKRSLELRLAQKGLPRQTIAFVNTIVYPFILLAGFLSSYFIRLGVAMRRYHLSVIFDVLVCIHRFYLSVILVKGEEISTFFFVQLVLNYMLGLAEHWTFYFWFGHLNLVATDLAYSSTILGIFTSVNNAADWGVNTLGLKTIAFFEERYKDDGYNGCVLFFTFCALLSMCLLWRYTYYLDEMPVKE